MSHQTNKDIMKTIHMITLIAVSLVTSGTSYARGGGGGGGGYGGPPQTDAERAARQEECRKANGGNCRNDGICDGQGQGMGRGKRDGQGNGQRRGPHDGSGPRRGGANCPAGN